MHFSVLLVVDNHHYTWDNMGVNNLLGENQTMETIKIAIRWDSEASIKQAEKDKLALENKGFTQVNSFGGIFESVLIYANLN
tara:strand:+ start:646 stop:891 length:246 start_codon:yes stop_codon:yes gene_type:complete